MKKWLVFFLFTVPLWSKSQSFSNIESVKKVFNNLVQAYANGKGAPDLMIVPFNEIQVKAEYYTTKDGNPVIKIDQQLINICFSLGKDSINALAFILSHELSHYYRDDNWCMDYAKFKYKTNPAIAKKMKEASEGNKEKEAIADKEGLLHAGIAGYSSFEVFNKLIDAIYSNYKLQDNLDGYPTKDIRKGINRYARADAQKWLSVFDAGTILIYASKYQEAIDCFTYLSKKFPSREVFNNLGTAQLLWAIKIKPPEPIEYIYPVEIDPQSRLNSSINISRSIDSSSKFEELLNMALQNFEKAKQIDPTYQKVYVNLACVYDLQGNFDLSSGYSKKVNITSSEYKNALGIRAITYAHQNRIEDANNCFLEIQQLTTDSNNYNYKMFLFGNENLVAAENFKNNWKINKVIDSSSFQKLIVLFKKNSLTSKSNIFQTLINGKSIRSINYTFFDNKFDYLIETNGGELHFLKYYLVQNDMELNCFQNKTLLINKKGIIELEKISTKSVLIFYDKDNY